MASPLVSVAFPDVLDVRFRDIAMGTYEKGKSRIPDFFDVQTSDRPDERYSELTPMGPFQAFVGAVPYDGASQGYDVTATHLDTGVAIQ